MIHLLVIRLCIFFRVEMFCWSGWSSKSDQKHLFAFTPTGFDRGGLLVYGKLHHMDSACAFRTSKVSPSAMWAWRRRR